MGPPPSGAYQLLPQPPDVQRLMAALGEAKTTFDKLKKGAAADSEAAVGAWNSQVQPHAELSSGGRPCARARVYLYQAPFMPSVRYRDGQEEFSVPPGWAVLRSRQGLLVWLELLGDASVLTQALEPGEALAAQRQLMLRLPTTTGQLFGQVELRPLGLHSMDAPLPVPCEDVAAINPGSGSKDGVYAALGTPGTASNFDAIFKGWLSAWGEQV